MGKAQSARGTDTPQDSPNPPAIPANIEKEMDFFSDVLEPAKSLLNNYLTDIGLNQATIDAATTAGEQLKIKKEHFDKARESVDVYDNILNNDASLLAKAMEKTALEIDGNVAKAVEINKLLASAKTAIQVSKDKLTANEGIAENLWDKVRRDLNDDTNVKKIGAEKLDKAIKEYSMEIQQAADDMNAALVKIGKIDGAVQVDKLKQLAQSTKAKTDAYKTDIMASLEFSKEKLKQTHADYLNALAVDSEAKYNVGADERRLNALNELKTAINDFLKNKQNK